MPIVLRDGERSNYSALDSKFSYDYPEGLDLTPKSPLHERIVKEVLLRAQNSYDVMSARYPAWKEIDETLTAYIRPDTKEREILSADSRKPVSIVVPQSYAMLEILLTYLTVALLEKPIIRYEGTGPEDLLGAILLEKVVEQQMYYTKAPLALHTFLRDGLAYGLGAAAPIWVTETTTRSVARDSMMGTLGALFGMKPKKVRTQETELLFEGNEIRNIDPYLYLPDPSVACHKMQEGEFVGWIQPSTYTNLLKMERGDPNIFNVRYLKTIGTGESRYYKADSSGRNTRTGISSPINRSGGLSRVDTIYMYIDIIPEDWKLGDSDYPETWLFGLAADSIVIQARPLNLNHGKKPVVTFAPDYDGYGPVPVAKLEIVKGLQTTLDWLFNSHVANVRKAINDMFIVDPSLLNINDLKSPGPGKLIRMRKSAWGRGVENAIKQFNVTDITKNHMGDSAIIGDLIRNVGGSVDAISGFRRKTAERVTAEEVRRDASSGLSRLEKTAKVASWMAFQDLGMMLASHTQQLMSKETYVKAVGNWADVLAADYGVAMGDRIMVDPMDILVAYDVVVKDGSVPGANFNPEVWAQYLPVILQDPEIRQSLDIVRLMKHIILNTGGKDVNFFDRKQPVQQPQTPQVPQVQAQVMPDQQVQQQVQAGNLVPAEQGM